MSSASVSIAIEQRRRYWRLSLAVLTILFIVAIVISTCIGPVFITPFKVVSVILNINLEQTPAPIRNIILNIRMPRVLLSALVGASLAVAGAILQGIFRNPLADPYIIGVSSGASLGAVLAMIVGIGFSLFGVAAISIVAFISAMLTLILVYNLARVGGRVPVTTLLLAGVIVGIFLHAVTTVIIYFGGEKLHGAFLWLLGSFSTATWPQVQALLPVIVVAAIVAELYTRDLNIMSLGEETALTLGVDVEHVKKVLVAVAALLTAVSVSVSGVIGFVGLVVPHMMRLIIGPDHRILLPASLLAGATFLAACDTIARTVIAPIELPVGVITALCGGPFFIYLLRKKKGEYSL